MDEFSFSSVRLFLIEKTSFLFYSSLFSFPHSRSTFSFSRYLTDQLLSPYHSWYVYFFRHICGSVVSHQNYTIPFNVRILISFLLHRQAFLFPEKARNGRRESYKEPATYKLLSKSRVGPYTLCSYNH